MEALLFIKPVYLFEVSATYWACDGNVVCLISNLYDWFLIPIRWDFHSFCHHCAGILQWYVTRQLDWLLLATYVCPWLSTLYSSLLMLHCFMELCETERWSRRNPVQLRNWITNPNFFLIPSLWQCCFSSHTVCVDNLLLCKHGGAHSQMLCKCKIQVFFLCLICSLYEWITPTVVIFDILELIWLCKYAI
jgi:hypothetical protein